MDVQKNEDGNSSSGYSSVQQERSDSPEHSCVSMKSDCSMDPPPKLNGGDTRPNLSSVQQERSDSPEHSCVSMKSDCSMDPPPKLKGGDTWPKLRRILRSRSDEMEPICKKMKYDESMNQPLDFNESMGPGDSHEVLKTFRLNLMKKFECLYEGPAKQGNPTLLNEIYTELYITESESGEISNEHEVRQIETQSRRAATEDTPIKCSDIFRALPGQDKPIRTVLTKGVAGIGKTVSVQKFILDWAEGKENQDVQLIFPLPFREINLMKDKTLSLSDLLHFFFPETKEMDIFSDEYEVLFIFDGLDECRLSLDFQSTVRLCDVSESVSVNVLLTNLIVGNLLPSALIWITSRPAAADLVPSDRVHRVTEVRGFNDPQKEEYFRKRISDQSLADRIISHLKSSRSLSIMCHIPVFCWISAAVLEKMMSRAETGEIPKTLTQMYTHFLLLQTNIKHEKDYEKKVTDEDMILKLGKVAFQQLVKGNVIFYEEDLRECGIDVTEASVYSGLCSQIFREEFGLYQGKVFCFVHLSIQEHLAALYVHLSYKNNRSQFLYDVSSELSEFFTYNLSDVHQKAVDKAIQSKNGHLDLFLRFLLGLSVKNNQILLQRLMNQPRSSSDSIEKTVEYIKMKIRATQFPEKSINLFHCLNELGDHSLVEEIQQYLRSGTIKEVKLSSSQWSAVAFVLLTSEKNLDEFRLKEFVGAENKADHILQKLVPVIKESRRSNLCKCGVTDEGCAALASVLRSNSSQLRELNLSDNELGDSGVMRLSSGLEIPDCKLEILRLSGCGLADEGCAALASALRSNPEHLRELDLAENILGDSGVKYLSSGLKNPHLKLEILRLYNCGITGKGCAALASALRSNTSHLRELDLADNELEDSGVEILSTGLLNPECKLEILRLNNCRFTDEGCDHLASVLRSNTSHLRELDLSDNDLEDSGVMRLSSGLKNPDCKLEKLGLKYCGISTKGCAALGSALRSNPSHLRELNLNVKELRKPGRELLTNLLKSSLYKLESLL
ncbi:NACHT, LRR and PYD domains-containing protein 12-like isoform X2 [Cyprinus carpio]|uniref:NACHT, LRR and PYD domains-containing protein 12-like isoform X2 n=1 Tax=Cyprinus carpio TaxID=7962 RepID=A0A9Q9YXU2_CYPCA|nr:NACHT, LRR and PYD domains-containing protein 12-like isoform X2 [Cyprinus carpio]